MPKATTPVSAARQARRHNPLEDDLTATGPLKNKPGKRKSRHQDEGEQFVDSKASRKILRMGQELADEDKEEGNSAIKANPAFEFESRLGGEEDDEPDVEYEEWGDDDEEVEEIEVSPEDLETFNKFFPEDEDQLLKTGWGGKADEEEDQGTNLADLILEKIAMHEAAQGGNGAAHNEPGPIDEEFEIPPKVVEVYTKFVMLFSELGRNANCMQSWLVTITVQIGQITKTIQDSSNCTSVGRYTGYHSTREMDHKCLL